jgi:hypothetical protein
MYMNMRIILISVLILLLMAHSVLVSAWTSHDPEFHWIISGYVRDAETGEGLVGASILIRDYEKGTVTNLYGFYSISLNPGEYKLEYSYVGYEKKDVTVKLDRNLIVNVELSTFVRKLEEVSVNAEGPGAHLESAEMSSVRLTGRSIRKIPALMGEVDIIKAIELLPGVQASSEGSSGFSVRGGNPDQNLILLDEAPVYNASHLMGFFSVFNNDAIKDVKLYKGDIPAEYGGRLSSLLDVRMKDGSNKKFAVSGGVGTISSRITLEGPLVKDKISFILSGRRTYADLFLPFAREEVVRKSKLYFYDLNAKLNWIINDRNRVYLSGYSGKDVFKNQFAGIGFGNNTFTARWNHLFGPRMFSNFTLVQSNYFYELGTPEGEANSFLWTSRMHDFSGKEDFNYFITPGLSIKFGAGVILHKFRPGSAKGLGKESLFTEFILPDLHSLENNIYLSVEQSAGHHWKFRYGLRISTFHDIGKATVYQYDKKFEVADSATYGPGEFYQNYLTPEPRIAATYLIGSNSSVKLSYSRTSQFIHLAQNSTAGTPLDVWFPSSPNVSPQVCDQIATGYFRDFFNKTVEASIEIYYKKINHAIDFKDHASLLLNRYIEGELRFGSAESYGMEFFVRKNEGRLTGWISYTLSKTQREFRDINNGKPYPAPYDRPNDVSVVLNYEISQRVWIAANWVYCTGLPVTFPTGRFEYMGRIAPVYSDRNSYRMPDYHRLDLSVSLQSRTRPGKRWNWDLNLSVYNAYYRKNAWAINFVQDDQDPTVTHAEMTYLFPIIPALTFNFRY